MPVDYDRARAMASAVAGIYQSAEIRLVRLITKQLAAGSWAETGWAARKLAETKAVGRAAELVADATIRDGSRAARRAVADGYRSGNAAAAVDLAELLAGDVGPLARGAHQGFGNAIQALADAAVQELRPVHQAILPQAVAAYRRAITNATARKLAGAQDLRHAAQAAWQSLADDGVVRFVDAAGRNWTMSTYVEMAVRTAVSRSMVHGLADQCVAQGVYQASVVDRPRECPRCRPWEGRVLQLRGPKQDPAVATLDEAMRKGLMHPNCRHELRGFVAGRNVPRLSPVPEGQQGYEAEQEQRRLERGIRAWRIREASAFTTEASQQAMIKVHAWTNRLEDHLAVHPRLLRKKHREQPGAGFVPRSPSDPAD